MKIRITATYEYEVDPAAAGDSYGTTDPKRIIEIDSENAWDLLMEELQEGDDIVIKVEEVKE
jgi:hypothetical protein